VRNPTFTPDVADLYVLRFEATNSSGRFAIGTLNLDSIATQPQIRSIGMAANSVVIHGDSGTPGGTFSVLTATNAAQPLAGWTELPGGIFDGSGRFGFTNGTSPVIPVQVYLRFWMVRSSSSSAHASRSRETTFSPRGFVARVFFHFFRRVCPAASVSRPLGISTNR
jgi:hypothetical protein